MTETLEQTLTAYDAWLERQPLAVKTRTAYRFQVHQYGAYLAQHPLTSVDPLYTPFARDYAIRDYKTYLKTERQAKPCTGYLGHPFKKRHLETEKDSLHWFANTGGLV